MGPRALRAARLSRLRYYQNQRLQLQVNTARRLLKLKRLQLWLFVALVVGLLFVIGGAGAVVVHRVVG